MNAGETLTLIDALTVDDKAKGIARYWSEWNMLRQNKVDQWEEVRRYKYAVDTSTTANADLPWKNRTTLPKLTQIADNLQANYMKSLFPKRQWIVWEGYDKTSEEKSKKDAIEQYMSNVVDRTEFKKTMSDLLSDWIETGNMFATVEWCDDRVELAGKVQTGYVGPVLKRISPLDIVFNPIAPTFKHTPKIVRKWVTLGDLKKEVERLTSNEEKAKELWKYLSELRQPTSAAFSADVGEKDDFLRVDGFTDFRSYLGSDYAEILTFYGDLFIRDTGEFLENHVITIVDRHKVIAAEPNPSYFGTAPIYHCAWRPRQDNLWGMGPLDNLVGMQYRIDHLENLKADVFDLNAFPPLKIKGFVEDFTWEPMARIYVGDEGDVEMVAPHFEILNANLEIDGLESKMERMVGAPQEAMGIRSPGEKTKYEVQRLESAAGRIFQFRLDQAEAMEEEALSAMLELARRKMTSDTLRVFDDELKIATFQTLTPQDITGNGRLRPVAAKHFAEQAERVQNATAFFNSQVGVDPAVSVHYSGLGLAKMFEDLLDLKGYKLVTPYVRVSEMAEAQNLGNAAAEQGMAAASTPSGQTIDDVSPEAANGYE